MSGFKTARWYLDRPQLICRCRATDVACRAATEWLRSVAPLVRCLARLDVMYNPSALDNIWLNMFRLVAMAVAAGLTFHVGLQACEASNPDQKRLCDAALSGHFEHVKTLLQLHRVPRDTVHHVLKDHLVLDIAAVCTDDPELDRKLCEVLRVLADDGWRLDVKSPQTGENALRILVRQNGKTTKRITFFIDAVAHPDSQLMNMLAYLQRLWNAARRGDAFTVTSMLQACFFPLNTVHHVLKHHLVLEIAAAWTFDQAHDRRLCDMLRVLDSVGWRLDVQSARTGENALHILIGQVGVTSERIAFFIDALAHRRSWLRNMLADGDRRGRMPEACLMISDRREIMRTLPDQRRAIRRARTADAAQAEKMP
eukprot:jgi/Ulvmu1/7397/UM036_0057.1